MNIVYQAYGSIENLNQTAFSIVSLLSKTGEETGFQVCIYTDQESYFKNIFNKELGQAKPRIVIEVVTANQLQQWRGEINFVHRVKIEILMHAAQKWKGPIIYLDGDTYFYKNPLPTFQKVNESTSLMHLPEARLDRGRDPLSKKICKFVNKNQFVVDSTVVEIPAETVMWNAGVIGLSEMNKVLLPKILKLTDEMHSRYAKHVMEQLAVSFYLQACTRVQACDDIVGHYWNQKPEFNIAIDQFLTKHKALDQLVENLPSFYWPGPPQKKQKKTILSRLTKWVGF